MAVSAHRSSQTCVNPCHRNHARFQESDKWRERKEGGAGGERKKTRPNVCWWDVLGVANGTETLCCRLCPTGGPIRGAGPAAASSRIHSTSTLAAFPHLPLSATAKLQQQQKNLSSITLQKLSWKRSKRVMTEYTSTKTQLK